MKPSTHRVSRRRRRLVAGLTGAFVATCVFRSAVAGVDAIVPAVRQLTGSEQVRPGRVKLTIPRLADNGNLVACRISVESPMTEADHVRRVGLFSEKNPRQGGAHRRNEAQCTEQGDSGHVELLRTRRTHRPCHARPRQPATTRGAGRGIFNTDTE